MNTTPNAQTANAPGVGISELLACPFCGAPAKLETTAMPLTGWWREWDVTCSLCNAQVGTSWCDSPQEAANRWNHRAR
jgi:hypothetical protein